MQQLYDAITDEQVLYQKRKQKLMGDVENILASNQIKEEKEDQQLQLVSEKSFSDLNELKTMAINIDSQVKVVQVAANKTMQNFESLRTQKKNVENILNTLSAFLELKRINENLPQAIEDQNIDKCLKLAQSFYSIEELLIREFCGQDFANVKKLIDIDLVELQKRTFEKALKDNDINIINSCAGLAKVLKIEGENSLEKVQKVHGNELKQKLLALEEEMFDKSPQELTEDYELPYLWHFVRILEKINDQSENFAENIISFYGKDGFNQFVYYMIENISHPFLVGIFKRLTQFFNINLKEEQQPQQQQYQQQQSGLVQCLSNTIFNDQEILKLSLFCEEISAISGQFQQFISHIGSLTSEPTTIFDKLSIQTIMMDNLGKFVQYSQKELSQQLAQLIQKSESLQSLWHFDKNKIQDLTEMKEPLLGNGLHEWLEEVFFIIKNKIKRSISTENQMIASAIINHIGYCVISEDLYQVTIQLINRYLKKEYFSSNAIGFNNKYTVHNTFMILLMNIVSSIPKYLKSLKTQVYQELQGTQSNMIVGAIEEMVESNQKKFNKLIDDKLRTLGDYLKSTIKFLFDDVKSLNFCGNENVMVEQEREYTKLFSQQFKQVLGSSMEQWREQLSRDNYEQMMIYLCENISRHFEQIIMQKQFHQMGGIIIEKEMRSIINFFARFQNQTNGNVKQCFLKVQLICEGLMLESDQDMEDFLGNSGIGELSVSEIKRIGNLRIDGKK